MTCDVSQGVVYCQTDPLGAALFVFLGVALLVWAYWLGKARGQTKTLRYVVAHLEAAIDHEDGDLEVGGE